MSFWLWPFIALTEAFQSDFAYIMRLSVNSFLRKRYRAFKQDSRYLKHKTKKGGGQFDPESGGHFKSESGGQFERNLHSKGVMNDMLLTKTFFKTHEKLSINQAQSQSFQEYFLKTINGSTKSGTKAVFTALQVKEGGIIECLSIPSPGSPYRRLIDFGHDSGNSTDYLNTYLSAAFSWFIS